jgi:hypothetical protein
VITHSTSITAAASSAEAAPAATAIAHRLDVPWIDDVELLIDGRYGRCGTARGRLGIPRLVRASDTSGAARRRGRRAAPARAGRDLGSSRPRPLARAPRGRRPPDGTARSATPCSGRSRRTSPATVRSRPPTTTWPRTAGRWPGSRRSGSSVSSGRTTRCWRATRRRSSCSRARSAIGSRPRSATLAAAPGPLRSAGGRVGARRARVARGGRPQPLCAGARAPTISAAGGQATSQPCALDGRA